MTWRHIGAGISSLAFLLACCPPPATAAAERPPFRLGPVTAAAGSVRHGTLSVPAGADGATEIPVTVVHGMAAGPVLALIAGVHGAEITPILALQALVRRLDPARLRGTVILVHVANLPGFLTRSVNVNPIDRKNLNRVYPGRADGSITERMAHVLATEVIPRATAVVDIHSGDAHEDLRPWAGYYARLGTPDVIAKSRAMAVAFGLPYVVEFPFVPRAEEPARYTGVVAVRRGIPAFDVEVGRLGNVEPALVDVVLTGLGRPLRHLGMEEGEAPSSSAVRFVRARATVTAEATGIFHGRVRAGEDVEAGAVLGVVTDFHGRPLQQVLAPRAGHLLHVLATPAVSRDEDIATIATDTVLVP